MAARRRRKRLLERFTPEDVDEVIFWKRDLLTTDLICCQVTLVHGQKLVFDEEEPCWPRLLAALATLDGFDADWFAKVSQPPFAERLTVAFARLE